jgi:hypothetical protein
MDIGINDSSPEMKYVGFYKTKLMGKTDLLLQAFISRINNPTI